VRIVPGAEDPGTRRRRLAPERLARSEACAVLRLTAGAEPGGRERFRFAPWLTTLWWTIVGEGGLLLKKERLGGRSESDHPTKVVVSLLEPPVRTAGRAYVEFEVVGLGDEMDMHSIQFGVMSLDVPPDYWMAEAPGQHMVGSESRRDAVSRSPCAPRQHKPQGDAGRPGDWFEGDRVGLLVDSGRLYVFINNALIARPVRVYTNGRLSHTPDQSADRGIFAEGLLSTVRFAVRFRGSGSNHCVRIIEGAPYPGDDSDIVATPPTTFPNVSCTAAVPREGQPEASVALPEATVDSAVGCCESSDEWETDEDWGSDCQSKSSAEGSDTEAGRAAQQTAAARTPQHQGRRVVLNGKEVFLDDRAQQRQEMAAMGFSRDAVEMALAFNGGSVEASVEWLLDPSSLQWLAIVGAGGPRVSIQMRLLVDVSCA
jgi:hypothetical protein